MMNMAFYPSVSMKPIFLILSICVFTSTEATRLQECLNNHCEVSGKKIPAACEPRNTRKNVATLAKIIVSPKNATCGTPVVQFCSLRNRISCLKCSKNSHSPSHIIDGHKWTWWQSKPWPGLPGKTFEVNITINLPKKFQLIDDIIIDFHDGLPQKMIVDKSSDGGKTWQPIQYYADNCSNHNMYHTDFANPSTDVNLSTKPICSQDFSTNFIWEDKSTMKVYIAPRIRLLRRKGLNDSSLCEEISNKNSELSKFLLITNLRIRLQQPPMVRADSSNDGLHQRSEQYGIRNIYIPARCFCNGHASQCGYSSKSAWCICRHFTEGRDCEKCKVLYWMKPWEPGSYSSTSEIGVVNQCTSFQELGIERFTKNNEPVSFMSAEESVKKLNCNCNRHSKRCEEVRDFGILCVDCRHNTIGRNCHTCKNGYFRNIRKNLDHPEVCAACKCDYIGSNSQWCQPGGQCLCRPNFVGRRCDKCRAGWTIKNRVCARILPECLTEEVSCEDIDYPRLTPNGRYQCIQLDHGWCSCLEKQNCTEPSLFKKNKKLTGNFGLSRFKTTTTPLLYISITIFFIAFFFSPNDVYF
ncbi:netrin-G1-like [Styela clava]